MKLNSPTYTPLHKKISNVEGWGDLTGQTLYRVVILSEILFSFLQKFDFAFVTNLTIFEIKSGQKKATNFQKLAFKKNPQFLSYPHETR